MSAPDKPAPIRETLPEHLLPAARRLSRALYRGQTAINLLRQLQRCDNLDAISHSLNTTVRDFLNDEPATEAGTQEDEGLLREVWEESALSHDAGKYVEVQMTRSTWESLQRAFPTPSVSGSPDTKEGKA